MVETTPKWLGRRAVAMIVPFLTETGHQIKKVIVRDSVVSDMEGRE
jgi:hypothetical protein